MPAVILKGSGSGIRIGISRRAVKSFQELHSIAATGVVDDKTLAAINVPLDWRIQQVAINLQRWRYMPDDLGERHFFVNIPYFHSGRARVRQAGDGHSRRGREARE